MDLGDSGDDDGNGFARFIFLLVAAPLRTISHLVEFRQSAPLIVKLLNPDNFCLDHVNWTTQRAGIILHAKQDLQRRHQSRDA